MNQETEKTCEVLRLVLKEFEFCCMVLNPNKIATLNAVKKRLEEIECGE